MMMTARYKKALKKKLSISDILHGNYVEPYIYVFNGFAFDPSGMVYYPKSLEYQPNPKLERHVLEINNIFASFVKTFYTLSYVAPQSRALYHFSVAFGTKFISLRGEGIFIVEATSDGIIISLIGPVSEGICPSAISIVFKEDFPLQHPETFVQYARALLQFLNFHVSS